ncbi:50S ribosomal protein L37ae [Candidatus Woesearchaeota archaeon]|jgi:large subunit ribosomal protein L37Ae|nr:MAG: 50S ribosomal protein L37ae [Candidatus Woesearchaeota archaeon]
MAEKIKLGSAKRFGPRYGRTNRLKVARIESQYLGRHKCPYCSYVAARRISRGIWGCKKCSSKWAAKAYSLQLTKRSTGSQAVEEDLDALFAQDSALEEDEVEA